MFDQARYFGGPVQRIANTVGSGDIQTSKFCRVYLCDPPGGSSWIVRFPDATEGKLPLGTTIYYFNQGPSTVRLARKGAVGSTSLPSGWAAMVVLREYTADQRGKWSRVERAFNTPAHMVTVDHFYLWGNNPTAVSMQYFDHALLTWNAANALTYTRREATGFNVGSTIFTVGHFNSDVPVTKLEKKPEGKSGVWSTMTDCIFQPMKSCSSAFGDKGYVFGGVDENSVASYLPKNDVWTALAVLPQAFSYSSAVTLETESRIFIINGDPIPYGPSLMFHPATDSYEKIAYYAAATYERISSAAINGAVFMFGGRTDSTDFKDAVFCYSRATNAWTSKASLSTATADSACSRLFERILLAGGLQNGDAPIKTVQAYSAQTNSFAVRTALAANVSAARNTGVAAR